MASPLGVSSDGSALPRSKRRAAARSVGAILALTLAILHVPSLLAQDAPGSGRLAAGGFYDTYEFLDPLTLGVERVSLVTVPFGARYQVIERLGVELRSNFASATMSRPDGSDVTLSGLTDSELRADVTVVPQRLTISAAALLPTGESSQTLEQAELAGLIATDLLPFRISNWGTGGGFAVASVLTMPVGPFGVGLSAGYTVGREFEPIEDGELGYRPGDELRLRLAIDRNVGAAGKASLVLGAQRYQDDEFDGSSVYEPGDRYEAMGSFAFAAGAGSSGAVYAGIQHRGAGRLPLADLETPAQDLINAGLGLRVPRAFVTLVPTVDVRIFRREDGLGQGHLTSAGGSVEIPAGRVTVIPSLRGRFGDVMLFDEEESSVRGAEVGVAVRWRS